MMGSVWPSVLDTTGAAAGRFRDWLPAQPRQRPEWRYARLRTGELVLEGWP